MLALAALAQSPAPPDTAQVDTSRPNPFVRRGIPGLSEPYPNPAAGQTKIDYYAGPDLKGPATLRVFDFLGGEVLNLRLTRRDGAIILKVNTLDPGIYFYSLEVQGQIIATKRLVVIR